MHEARPRLGVTPRAYSRNIVILLVTDLPMLSRSHTFIIQSAVVDSAPFNLVRSAERAHHGTKLCDQNAVAIEINNVFIGLR